MTTDRTALMRRLFSRFDKDGSGQLDKKELQNATETLGDRFNDEDTAILMSIFDKVGMIMILQFSMS